MQQVTQIRSCLFGEADGGLLTGSAEGELSAERLKWMRHAARVHVQHNFNRKKNLKSFGDLFLARIVRTVEEIPNESFVLQQI